MNIVVITSTVLRKIDGSNLFGLSVMEDLIDVARIDAKHSNEDGIAVFS